MTAAVRTRKAAALLGALPPQKPAEPIKELDPEKAKLKAKLLKDLPNVGSRIDHLVALRDQKRQLEAQITKIEVEFEIVEDAVLEDLKVQGTTSSRTAIATASVTKNVAGSITDWDALTKYVKRTGYFHLFQRRLSDPAVRELLETKGGSIPGVTPFTNTRLNLRAN